MFDKKSRQNPIIKIALFDQPVEKGLFVNHSEGGAPECIEWLPVDVLSAPETS